MTSDDVTKQLEHVTKCKNQNSFKEEQNLENKIPHFVKTRSMNFTVNQFTAVKMLNRKVSLCPLYVKKAKNVWL